MAKTYNIFISHSWDHVNDLMNLRRLLENRGYFKVEFFEVPPHDPIESTNSNYIKSVIKHKIAQSDVVIGIAGIYASYSEWMKWELNTAKSMGKPVLGVIPWNQQRVSQIVDQISDKIVRWNTESIVEAIRQMA